MDRSPAVLRSAATLASVLLMAAVGLGLVAPTSAGASCAGPQLELEQAGVVVLPRRVGEGANERLLYDVSRDQPLRINGSNLTFDCQDTHPATPQGCGAPVPDAVEPIVPMHTPEVVLTQRGRSWTLGRVGAIGPDLTAQVDVELPRSAQPGPAVLSMREPKEASGLELELVIT